MTKILTPDETAKALKVTSKTIREWLKEGKIKGIKVGRQWRIFESELNTILEVGLFFSDKELFLDKDSKEWLKKYDEDLPEYIYSEEDQPKLKKIRFEKGKGFIIEDEYVP